MSKHLYLLAFAAVIDKIHCHGQLWTHNFYFHGVFGKTNAVLQAVNRLGLNTLSRFDYKSRIIEYVVDNSSVESPLMHLSVKDFVEEVAARKPAPGGGSVAALTGSLVRTLRLREDL